MKNFESSSATNDELLTITDKEHKGKVIANSLGKSSTLVWILDSKYSYHVCSNKSVFDTYEEMKGSKILLGNKTSCVVLVVRIVKINMHDSVVSLSDVRHVPTLRSNLISLGTLPYLLLYS